jgi:outer membrane receptor protein involved in Fe transport
MFRDCSTGKTFTTSDENNDYLIKPYFVLNAGLSATVAKKYTLGLRVNNITNEIYETMAYYPLPKRNYSFYINLNFKINYYIMKFNRLFQLLLALILVINVS